MGGALQIFFGIMGNRWLNRERVTILQNEHWIRPVNEDMPINSKLCENGCYW